MPPRDTAIAVAGAQAGAVAATIGNPDIARNIASHLVAEAPEELPAVGIATTGGSSSSGSNDAATQQAIDSSPVKRVHISEDPPDQDEPGE